MTIYLSQCEACIHYRFQNGHRICVAFPEEIPYGIYTNQVDHREPIEGDHGIRWAPSGEYGREHPGIQEST